MKVLQVHNRYRLRGGEDAVFDNTIRILRAGGVAVCTFARDSRDLPDTTAAKAGAMISGVWSGAAKRAMRATLRRERPDVVHVHNLYPLLSPSVLAACDDAGVPVVMTAHNYRLSCPIGTHYVHGAACMRCAGGHEQHCFLRNCRGSRAESAGYALRSWLANRNHWFRRPVQRFLAISAYLRDHLITQGFDADTVTVVPNTVAIPADATDPAEGSYALFCGRLSEEKGVDILIAAAHAAPEVPVRIAGDGPLRPALESIAPPNVRFLGRLDAGELAAAYRGARFFVAPAMWHEAFGLVVAEAMAHGLPVIASRMGAHTELIADGARGHLFSAGDDTALAETMHALWKDPARCRDMGAAARRYAAEEFGEARYFERLIAVYQEVTANAAEPGIST